MPRLIFVLCILSFLVLGGCSETTDKDSVSYNIADINIKEKPDSSIHTWALFFRHH